MDNFLQQLYNNLIVEDRYQIILSGLMITVLIAFFAAMIGACIGTGIALVKVNVKESPKLKIAEKICDIYLAVFKGTPVVVQLFIMCYIILDIPSLSKIIVAIITFGLNSGAYIAEYIRAGIISVDIGQTEAGRSLGLSNKTTMLKIVLPQALKTILPAVTNEFVALIKETSVAGMIGVYDLTKAGDVIMSRTYDPIVPLITVAIIYFIMVSGLVNLFGKFERRLRQSDKR